MRQQLSEQLKLKYANSCTVTSEMVLLMDSEISVGQDFGIMIRANKDFF